jgi:ABC-type antimicrobial peptide transport system permease subunit
VIGFAVGGGAAVLLGSLTPPDFPLLLRAGRVFTTFVVLVGCSVLGSITSLRRVVRIDAATAIGTGT